MEARTGRWVSEPTYGSGQKAREEVPVSNSGTQNQFTSLAGKSQLLFYVGASTVADDKTNWTREWSCTGCPTASK